jgi:hypothetical protein
MATALKIFKRCHRQHFQFFSAVADSAYKKFFKNKRNYFLWQILSPVADSALQFEMLSPTPLKDF